MRLTSEQRRLAWGEGETAPVDSLEELDWRLDELTERAKAQPFMAELIVANGNSVSMGLGRDESVMSWVGASKEPPYYASKGNVANEGMVVFFYGGQWSEFPRWSAVAVKVAREAMREFWKTGERPTSVAWEEV